MAKGRAALVKVAAAAVDFHAAIFASRKCATGKLLNLCIPSARANRVNRGEFFFASWWIGREGQKQWNSAAARAANH